MCDVAGAFKRIFTIPGTGGLEAADQSQRAAQKAAEDELAKQAAAIAAQQAEQNKVYQAGTQKLLEAQQATQDTLTEQTTSLLASNKTASAAATEALTAQTTALKQQQAAAKPVRDSESARLAAEARMRKLLAATAGAGQKFGAAPLGYRTLTGA
jgi:hypothetical protein